MSWYNDGKEFFWLELAFHQPNFTDIGNSLEKTCLNIFDKPNFLAYFSETSLILNFKRWLITVYHN